MSTHPFRAPERGEYPAAAISGAWIGQRVRIEYPDANLDPRPGDRLMIHGALREVHQDRHGTTVIFEMSETEYVLEPNSIVWVVTGIGY